MLMRVMYGIFYLLYLDMILGVCLMSDRVKRECEVMNRYVILVDIVVVRILVLMIEGRMLIWVVLIVMIQGEVLVLLVLEVRLGVLDG